MSKIEQITDSHWAELLPRSNPFLKKSFLTALERSQSIGSSAGWQPLYFTEPNGLLYTFIKSHSYGEYIFDWDWARAFSQYQLPYYPKLTSMIPLTPVTTSHFIMPKFEYDIASRLMDSYISFYENHELSSSHFLFITEEEIPLFENNKHTIRESFQYHFYNENYATFEDYLLCLKSKKAKNIRLERHFPNLRIEKITSSNLTKKHADEMYQLYLSTIEVKNAIDYLKEEFFQIVFQEMKDNILFVRASKDERIIAGSLFFYDDQRLFGRYWGALEQVENLHFELCYYQGIEFSIEKQLKVFEAGAQGEHKISRGFKPVRTFSAHHIKNKDFHHAISNYISEEKRLIQSTIEELSKHLPFKKSF